MTVWSGFFFFKNVRAVLTGRNRFYFRFGTSPRRRTYTILLLCISSGVRRATARQVQVTLGDYVINSAVEPLPAYTFGVRKISVHPFFKFTPQADRFDVAVLRLDRPVQYMPHIAPICLPDKGEDFLGNYGWAAGWGALQAGKYDRRFYEHIENTSGIRYNY